VSLARIAFAPMLMTVAPLNSSKYFLQDTKYSLQIVRIMSTSDEESVASIDELQDPKVHSKLENAPSTFDRESRNSPGRNSAESGDVEDVENADETDELAIEIHVPIPKKPWEYDRVSEGSDDVTVDSVLLEVNRGDEIWYKIAYADGRDDTVS
jgi:hypothetical protein